MASTNEKQPEASTVANPLAPEAKQGSPAPHDGEHGPTSPQPPPPSPPHQQITTPRGRRWLVWSLVVIGLAVGLYFFIPWLIVALNTVSTDDAYVNGHVTLVAPRVAGQVQKVLVDDNYRVKKGDILVQLDKEPYEVQLAIRQAAVTTAQANLTGAQASVRAQVAQTRAGRYRLEHAIEEVENQVANLRASVAALNRHKADLALAKANLKRGEELAPRGGISKEDLDQRRQSVKTAEAAVEEALQSVYAIRVGLGLPAQPPKGQELSDVPANLEQNFSSVRQALGTVLQSAAQLGYYPTTWNATPKQAIADFYKLDPEGNLDRIYQQIIDNAPALKEAEAKLLQAQRDLDQAKLNLRYCDVVSEIDGVVTRRNVNPGNNVAVGQNLMAVRSLTEIWIDANFKETQLAYLRIGQRVRCEVDMYGSRREYEGRITGFTMGTGQTLALLPPQNATGNFVKIVQRLPVRIELTNYDPEKETLFVGLSVVPYVYYKEAPTGPNAGSFLQLPRSLPETSPNPKP